MRQASSRTATRVVVEVPGAEDDGFVVVRCPLSPPHPERTPAVTAAAATVATAVAAGERSRRCGSGMRGPVSHAGSAVGALRYRSGVALRGFVQRVLRPVDEIDSERLSAFAAAQDAVPIAQVQPRKRVRVAGEVKILGVVPRAGAPALEVTIDDGASRITAVFLGRRRIGGVTAGRRIVLDGMVTTDRGRPTLINPTYELF